MTKLLHHLGRSVGIPQRQRIFAVFLGLTSMPERVEMLGGTFEIKADPGNGTIVNAAVPVNGNHRPQK